MSFCPPPNWPVPQDWSPPPGWEPDPTWPPAPPGWTFWVDDPHGRREESLSTGEARLAPDKPRRRRRWGPPATVLAVSIVVVAVLAAGAALLVAHKPGPPTRTQPPTVLHEPSAAPNSTPVPKPGGVTPDWGMTPLYIDFGSWTRFGGIDAQFADKGQQVLLDTHDTTDTWHTKWSGLISAKTTACAVRIVGQVRDISHTDGVPGGFGFGLGTLAPGDLSDATLSGTAVQIDFGQKGFRTALYPSDSDAGLAPAALDHQWHQIDVTINRASHTLLVDGQMAVSTAAGGQCGHPFIRVWAGSAQFDQFTVTPLD